MEGGPSVEGGQGLNGGLRKGGAIYAARGSSLVVVNSTFSDTGVLGLTPTQNRYTSRLGDGGGSINTVGSGAMIVDCHFSKSHSGSFGGGHQSTRGQH